MQVKLPYLTTPGLIPRIFAKISEARRPERFTQDFLETKLGFSGGSARAMIPLLKRMEFLSGDGTPTRLYDQFRNPTTQRVAQAQGVRNAYADIFDRNRYAADLSRDKFAALVLEMSGLEKDSSVAKLIVSTFWTLREGGDFESDAEPSASTDEPRVKQEPVIAMPAQAAHESAPNPNSVRFSIGYNINLNLPETTNPEVFNAIFKALKGNLLTE